MRLTNKLNLPQPLVDAIALDEYSRGAADISVTGLLSPPRKTELERVHADELEEDAADGIFRLLGTVMHKVLERASTTGIAEERLFMDVGGWRVSGQMDRRADGLIEDWKLVSVNEGIFGVKAEREEQLNCYAHLARVNGIEVNAVRAVLVFRDWSKRTARVRQGYPRKPVMLADLPLWAPARAQVFMEERVRLHQAARAAMPECTAEERWVRPDTWAVMKPGRKSALRVLDWEAEAIAWLRENPTPRGEIVRRPGESVRCVDYCAARPFCSQAAALETGAEDTE